MVCFGIGTGRLQGQSSIGLVGLVASVALVVRLANSVIGMWHGPADGISVGFDSVVVAVQIGGIFHINILDGSGQNALLRTSEGSLPWCGYTFFH